MSYIVKMPKLGLEMVEGTVLDWKLDEGEPTDADDVLLEIESEKTVADVESREDGVLRRRYVGEGETVEPGTPLGIVAPADADVDELVEEAERELDDASQVTTAGESASSRAGSGGERATPEDADSVNATPGDADRATATAEDGDPVKATPRAASRAEELGVELAAVEGTGYEGAVSAADVEAYVAEGGDAAEPDAAESEEGVEAADATDAESKVTPRARQLVEEQDVDPAAIEGTGYDGAVTADDVEAAVESADGGPAGPVAGDPSSAEGGSSTGRGSPSLTVADAHELGSTRRTIARRLGESDREAVHVTIHRSADVEAVESVVDDLRAAGCDDCSLVDLLIAALSDALEAHPAFNARFEDDVHRSYEEHNVAVAVDAESGLVTPTIDDVRGLSVERIAAERRQLTERALEGAATADDLAGGTFTVTNLGPQGVEWFDPVIDPPQVAILGLGAVSERPATGADGAVELRRELPLSLSFDHRVVDGADAARFLATLVDSLEHPSDVSAVEQSVGGRPADGPSTDEPTAAGVGADPSADAPDVGVRRAVAGTDAGMSGTVATGGLEVPFDEPEDLGGEGSAPSPVALFLASFAACLSLSVRFQAEKHSLELGSVEVDVDGAPERGAIESIHARVSLEADAPDEVVDRLVDTAERGCHVSAAIDPDVPVEVVWTRRR